MNKKLITVAATLCLLSLGSFAFGNEWQFQAMWHAAGTDMCNYGATDTNTNDWFDPNGWGVINNSGGGMGSCANYEFPGWIMWAVLEAADKGLCSVSQYSPLWPGTDANGYEAYCGQLMLMPWSWEYARDQVLTVDANFNCGVRIAVGPWAYPETWGHPIIDVNGGTMTTPGIRNFDPNNPYDPCAIPDPNYTWIGGDGLAIGSSGSNYGIVNIRNTGKIEVPRVQIWNGEINILPSGLLYHNDPCTTYFFISQARARNHINIAGGELRLIGDRMDQVLYYLSKGRLTPCDGHGDLHINYNGFDTSVTATCTPDSAWNPNPIDGAIGVALNKVLSWSPGPSTLTVGDNNAHDVYFGTSEADVCDANLINHRGVYKTSTDACSFDPGVLVMDTNYFWRVDEHNDVTIWKGNIWAFKSKGPQATDPIPGHLTTGIPLPIVLKWSPGAKVAGPNSHAVFFGTSRDDVASASATNPLGCFRGYVVDPVYKLSNLGFNLVADTTYYWKINESNGIDVWQGEVWQVLNANYYVVEDFDLYTDFDSMHAKWKMGSADYMPCPVGYGPSNGVIDYDMNDGDNKHMQFDYDDSFGESFSEVRFDATDGDAGGSDWSGGDVLPADNKCRSLAIGFIGNVNNQANGDYDRMYAAIEDTSGNFGMVSNSDFQAQRSFGWTQWYIDLNDFNDTASINLAHIKYLYLGFGGRCLANGSGLGGTGRVRFDDIRLYQQACNSLFLPVGDLTSDCKVDFADLDTMATAWLAGATVISPVTNPGTTGLRLWYKFEETTGTAIADSSGNGFKGEVNSTPLFADIDVTLTNNLWDPTGGYDGNGCFVSSAFSIADFNAYIEANTMALSPTQTSLTLSLWINGDTYMPLSGWARLISAFQDMNAAATDENEVIEIECPVPRTGNCGVMASIGVKGDGNAISNWSLPLSAFAGSWQHYAFVRSGADSNVSDPNRYNKISFYHNGELIVDANALRPIFGATTPYDGTKGVENFRLIKANPGWESWYGKIDDFKVYNRALSAAEIGWLGTKGTGSVPFSNSSNLKSSSPDRVNFGDLAILAQNWLTERRWPNP